MTVPGLGWHTTPLIARRRRTSFADRHHALRAPMFEESWDEGRNVGRWGGGGVVCQCRKRLARVVKQRLRLSRGQTFGAARHVATILSVRKMSCLSGRANPTRDTSHALTRKLGATKRCALRAYAPRGRCSRIVRPVNTRDPTTRRTEPRPTCAQSLVTLEEHDALGCQDRSGGGRYFKSSALSCEHAHPEARFASTIHVSSNNQAAGNTHEAVDGTVRVRTMRAQRATVLTKRTLGQFDRQRRPAGDEEAPPRPPVELGTGRRRSKT
jgi:hypothetical protein